MSLLRRGPPATTAAPRTLPRLNHVSGDDLGRLAATFDELHVPVGAVLTRQGRVATERYLIVEGEADVRVDGRLVARVGPGEFVGEMAVISGAVRSATVQATTPMHLLTAHKSGFWRVLDRPAIALTVLRHMTDRLRLTEAASAEADAAAEGTQR